MINDVAALLASMESAMQLHSCLVVQANDEQTIIRLWDLPPQHFDGSLEERTQAAVSYILLHAHAVVRQCERSRQVTPKGFQAMQLVKLLPSSRSTVATGQSLVATILDPDLLHYTPRLFESQESAEAYAQYSQCAIVRLPNGVFECIDTEILGALLAIQPLIEEWVTNPEVLKAKSRNHSEQADGDWVRQFGLEAEDPLYFDD